ncbi:hypothetical protein Afil01_62260 [Actinorhabdospora filicis]|uniref:Uncharacterized protein n=1 Tax=Actinorhabdospora filicis TaxID=1785913 RepID=A0A9W6SR60_9ACTN|nr:hypothetical protein Afil01_62260 [Actinorhabdospora filicis]
MRVTVRHTVCDLCGGKEVKTRRYEVSRTRRKVTLDICQSCAGPIEAAFGRDTSPPRQQRTPVLSRDDVRLTGD